MIRVTHFRKKCIGCNACVEANPLRWQISRKDGKSILISGKDKKGVFHFIAEDFEFDQNLMAAKNCPVGIIRIEKIYMPNFKK